MSVEREERERRREHRARVAIRGGRDEHRGDGAASECLAPIPDRKSTRLNSSHSQISYAVFCLKKKKKQKNVSNLPCSCYLICIYVHTLPLSAPLAPPSI